MDTSHLVKYKNVWPIHAILATKFNIMPGAIIRDFYHEECLDALEAIMVDSYNEYISNKLNEVSDAVR